MTEPAFDKVHVRRALATLERHQQVAFGAACCERILPNYNTFRAEVNWGNSEPLRRALDTVWKTCGDWHPGAQEVRHLLVACESKVPDSEDFESLYTSSAQDTVFAVCSLLDFLLSEDITYLVTTARYPVDSIDLFVQEYKNLDPQDAELEREILVQPLMQQELLRQKRDLAYVWQLHRDNGEALLALKSRAQGERAFALPE